MPGLTPVGDVKRVPPPIRLVTATYPTLLNVDFFSYLGLDPSNRYSLAYLVTRARRMAIHLHPDRDPSGATSGLTGLTIATANEILGYLTGVTDLPARDPNSSTGASLPVPSP